jgi:AraC family transcriptional regulator, glycine betaine-responsive activator
MILTSHLSTHSTRPSPYRVVFLTLPDFTLLAATAAIEVLRMANRVLGQNAYEWRIEAADPDHEAASCGLILGNGQTSFDPIEQAHLVLVCGGLQAERWLGDGLLNRLKDLNRRKVSLGGLCTGSLALAKAGLLDGYRATVHWENLNAL